MIRAHEFDSEWRGRPVGIVTDLSLLEEPPDSVDRLCASYEWVEARTDATLPEPTVAFQRAGFVKADTHIKFSLDLAQLGPEVPTGLDVVSYQESEFDPDLSTAYPFKMERFTILPEITYEMINQRYSYWARSLCEVAPTWCVQVSQGGQVQGWFFSQTLSEDELDLTLGVARADADIGGKSLFMAAFSSYWHTGATKCSASFSVRSLAVMNIYSSFGARFVGATDFWLRSPRWAGQ